LGDDTFSEFDVALMEDSESALKAFLSGSRCSELSLVRSQNIAKVISIRNQSFNGSRSSYCRSFKVLVRLNGYNLV